jgi:hypothetical protein
VSNEATITEVDLQAVLATSIQKPAKTLRAAAAISLREVIEIKKLVAQPNSATFVVTGQNAERVKILKQVISRLPALIEGANTGRLEKKVEQYIALMTDTTPLERARLEIEEDNVRFREDFVKEWECWDSATVHARSGDSSKNASQTAARWKARKKIFAVPYGPQQLFPAFQFREGKPLRVVNAVLECFGDQISPWQTAAWFVSENGWLDDATPQSLLIKGALAVVEAAKHEVETAVP